MKKKVLALIIIFTVAFGVLVFKPSFAWFLNEGTDKSQAIDISYFDISLVGGCDIRPVYTNELNTEYVAPGANMIHIEQTEDVWVPGPMTMLNKSTIPTNLRVRIEYSRWNGTALVPTVYSLTQQTDFSVDFAVPADWSYDAATECWNYLPGGGNVAPVDLVANPDGLQTVLINSMGYSDALESGNIYEDELVTVSFKVEAKQAEYATWTQVLT
jgi:hypothetical protein